jgi:hypothetical protein
MTSSGFERLRKDYLDKYGRVTFLPARQSDGDKKWDSLNQHLWTGVAELMSRALLGLNFTPAYSDNLHIFENKGVLSRQPFPYWTMPLDFKEAQRMGYSHGYDPVSLDEYLGYSFTGYTKEYIYEKAIENGWLLYDKDPSVKLKNILRFGLISEIAHIVWIAIKTRDFGGSNELDEYIYKTNYFKYLSRVIQPKDRYIIKLAHNRKPSIIDKIHFNLSVRDTLKKDEKKLSGKLLLFYKIMFLNQKGLDVHKMIKKYHDRMTELFGGDYLETIFFNYCDDKKHPFIEIVRGKNIYSFLVDN